MSLVVGTRLGPYEIQSAIGAGGMGEVYKARDTRLDRTVAIKILPPDVSGDPERRARFEREAKTVAGLSHPHICALFDVGEHDGSTFLVMEHLAGESLAERLQRGPIPLAHAIEIAAQTAEALDAAHKHGIIHRDLKPGNVMLTAGGSGRSGTVSAKLLDFGLAKLAAHGERPALAGGASAPTQSLPMTARGAIVGTLQYMAPEQLEGREADARTDLWALGALLYEMVTGKRAFEADSDVSLIGAILNTEPAGLATLQPLTPPSLERLVSRCLAKHPDSRWDTAHDVADELRWLASGSGATTVVRPSAVGTWRRTAFWLTATLLAGGGLGILLWSLVPRAAQPSARTSMRLAIALPPEMPLAPAGLVSPSHDRPALALSPDGTRLAYVALVGGETRMCVRNMQSGSVSVLDHTAAGHTPFFSPDGAWIGFFADTKLKRIPVGGGEATTLAEAPNPWGASWAPDDRIYFNRFEGEGVFRVGTRGGAPVEPVLSDTLAVGLMPEFTDAGPGLFVAGVQYIDLRGATPAARSMVKGDRARYVSSGHVIYNSGSALMAVPVDASTMAAIGDSVTLLEDLRTANYGVAQFTVSREGTLVYVSGRPQGLTSFVLVNRQGVAERLGLPEAEYGAYSLSPDGKNLAYALDREIYVWNRERRTSVRLSPRATAGTAALNSYPRWAPDGQTVVYSSTTAGSGARLLAAPVDGRPPVELWAAKDVPWLYPMRFSPDGAVLSAFRRGRDSSYDLYLLPVRASGGSLTAAGKPELFLGERFGECFGQISPDGRWMLFSSDQGGTYEIWATTYPTAGPRYRVSNGREAMWNPAVPGEVVVVDGRAVYAVDVTRGPAHPGNRKFLFDGPYPDTTGFGYDMTPDGRFLLLQNEDILKPTTTLTVVTNFFEELRRRVPPRGR